jgi:hypothetical protein
MINLRSWCLFVILALPAFSHGQGAASQISPERKWHTPYRMDTPTSQIFQVVDWESVQEMQIGMPVSRLKNLGISMLEPYGNADALFFSYAPGRMEYEVELKFSKQRISDISFRAVDRSDRGKKWNLDAPISMRMASPTPETESTAPFDTHSPAPGAGGIHSIVIPSPPKGCQLVVYGPLTLSSRDRHLVKMNGGTWDRYLKGMGVKFLNGGFAIYDKAARVLLVATTEEEQKMVSVLLSH